MRELGQEIRRGLHRRQRPLVLEHVEQSTGLALGALDVGLVEGVDVEQVPGHRRRHLPTKELRTEGVEVFELVDHHRLPGGDEGVDLVVEALPRSLAIAQRHEQSGITIAIRRHRRLAGDR